MTDHFNLKRFLLLIRKHGIENIKFYLLSSIALAFVLSFVLMFWRFTANDNFYEEVLYVIYIIGLIICGALFASLSFQQLSTKDKAIYYLSFPASRLEKLGVVLFYNIVVFTLTYSLIFFIIKGIFWTYVQSLAASNPKFYHVHPLEWYKEQGFTHAFPYLIFLYIAIQSLYILGSIYFSRFAFIKTTIVGSIFVVLYVWYFEQLMRGNGSDYDLRGSVTVYENGGVRKIYELPMIIYNTIQYAGGFIWAPVFFVVAYFRLKEKQV